LVVVVGDGAVLGRSGAVRSYICDPYTGGYSPCGGIVSNKHAIGAMELRIQIAKGALSNAMADVETCTTRLERATKRLSALNADIESYEKALAALKAEKDE
jgi:hypothetical protein